MLINISNRDIVCITIHDCMMMILRTETICVVKPRSPFLSLLAGEEIYTSN